jgi:hydrogenase maturation factor HypF (carbamoyltransferase family)
MVRENKIGGISCLSRCSEEKVLRTSALKDQIKINREHKPVSLMQKSYEYELCHAQNQTSEETLIPISVPIVALLRITRPLETEE